MLSESFNTTNQTMPMNHTIARHARHINYITDIKMPTCAFVVTLPPEERCAYIIKTSQCHNDEYLLDYMYFFYCIMDTSYIFYKMLGQIVLILATCVLFLVLGLTSSGFFCPALKVISDILGINENVAGVTLLAFGNCAPDIITGMSGLESDNRIIYTDVLGSAMFVVLFVGGLIIALCPCVVVGSLFLRDLLFVILSIAFIHVCYDSDYAVSLGEAIGIVIIYIFYIIAVVTDQALLKWQYGDAKTEGVHFEMESFHENLPKSSADENHLDSDSDDDNNRNERNVDHDDDNDDEDDNDSNVDRKVFILGHENDDLQPNNAEPRRSTLKQSLYIDETAEILWQFFFSLNPILEPEWAEASRYKKVLLILKSPVGCCLRLLIPLVDFELEDNGWSRLLNSLQVVLLPTFVAVILANDLTVSGFPVTYIVLLCCLPLALTLFFITTHKHEPKYHRYLAFFATAGSMFIIFSCAQEIVSILSVLGITTNCSSSFLGCTLLAWGNSLGDLVVNVTLARQGYEKMSLSACFGGPLFNILIGIGVAMIYKSSKSPDLKTDINTTGQGLMGMNLNLLMFLGLIVLAATITLTNFVLRRSIGIYMMAVYLIFFIMTILVEIEFIHPYSCEHRLQQEVEPAYEVN